MERYALLSPYRVLDITDEQGFFCGKILGDLGADVIKIEPPDGDPSRKAPPLFKCADGTEKSLYWQACNVNKRGITLNIETESGRALFRSLVKKADFTLESFPPGYMESIGLGYSNLSDLNPRIVMASITPFGQHGPYENYKGSDIVTVAMSGFMYHCGDPDRAPICISCPQAYFHAGAEAAIGVLSAHFHREITGKGQYVDLSIQETLVPTTERASHQWQLTGDIPRRMGRFRERPTTRTRIAQHWPCKDGYVSFSIMGGRAGMRQVQGLVSAMKSDGMAPTWLQQMDWDKFDMDKTGQDVFDKMSDAISKYFLRHSKADIYRDALDHRATVYPVYGIEDMLNDPQLISRDFWQKIDYPDLGTALMQPGLFVDIKGAPMKDWQAAPGIGEHNSDIYTGELGIDRDELRHHTQ